MFRALRFHRAAASRDGFFGPIPRSFIRDATPSGSGTSGWHAQNSLAADLGCKSSNTSLFDSVIFSASSLRTLSLSASTTFNASTTTRPCPANVSTSADDEPPAAAAAAPYSPRGAWIAKRATAASSVPSDPSEPRAECDASIFFATAF